MDPNATFAELKDAVSRNCGPEAREQAISLLDWLDKGGFPPDGTTAASCKVEIVKLLNKLKE